MVTIRDVARACGVSPMTVSFVINHKPGQVSEETRERVLKAVRELNYRPTAVGRSARLAEERQIHTLGAVVGVPGDSLVQPGYFSAILNSLLQGADALGQNVTLFNHSLLHRDAHRAIRVYCDGRCDGLLVVAPRIGSELVAAVRERGVPITLIGDTGDDEAVSCVDIDNEGAAYTLVTHLITLGHQRIVFIGGPAFVRSSQQRLAGYRRALSDHDLPLETGFVIDNLFHSHQIDAQVGALMSMPLPKRPTALFGWNDGTATDAAHRLQRMGLRIPDDVSVVGIDDLEAFTINPPLTTVAQPFRTMGRRAVEALVAQINRTEKAPRHVLPGELMIRASTGPPPDTH